MTTSYKIPNNSSIERKNYDYIDCFAEQFQDPQDTIDPVMLCKAFVRSAPQFVELLMTLRNTIVSMVGLKTGNDYPTIREEVIENFKGEPGENLGLFKVYSKSATEIILGENDKHLDFRLSLLIEPNNDNSYKSLSLTTVVSYNNWMGPTYFTIIKPFHKLIAKAMLRGIIKELKEVQETHI